LRRARSAAVSLWRDKHVRFSIRPKGTTRQ
jgi:hypothetical protein